MEELQRRSQSEDVPVELIQRIQSLLPVKDAARTCVLSKTWSHAWSTIPHLRFNVSSKFANEEKERDYIKFVDHTISKYVQENIPIERLKLKLDIKLASHLAHKWIPTVAAQSCLKELYIRICYESDHSKIILPDEIFSAKNLRTLSVKDCSLYRIEEILVSRNPVINCVNLRVLELEDVDISEEVLDNLFSTCILLEKIDVSFYPDLKTFKVRNLRYLQELHLFTRRPFDVLKIDDVPNLRLFIYYVWLSEYHPIKTFNMTSFTSVTELLLNDVMIDVAFLDMIKSKLPSLEILDLVIQNWTPERLDFTSCSLKIFKLKFSVKISESRQVDIHVYAPNLRQLNYSGRTMPSLVFPSSNAPEYIKLELALFRPVDRSFFLKMREVLNLSSKFDIDIRCYYHINETLNIDVDDHEIRFLLPSANVQQLSYYAYSHRHEKTFYTLLTICHPKYITICCNSGYYSPKNWFRNFFEHMKVGIMANKTSNLKDIKFKNPVNGKWEILTDSCITTILDAWDEWECELELKPNW